MATNVSPPSSLEIGLISVLGLHGLYSELVFLFLHGPAPLLLQSLGA
jgi:hypothetical protein